jgi:hypothetical protein
MVFANCTTPVYDVVFYPSDLVTRPAQSVKKWKRFHLNRPVRTLQKWKRFRPHLGWVLAKLPPKEASRQKSNVVFFEDLKNSFANDQ